MKPKQPFCRYLIAFSLAVGNVGVALLSVDLRLEYVLTINIPFGPPFSVKKVEAKFCEWMYLSIVLPLVVIVLEQDGFLLDKSKLLKGQLLVLEPSYWPIKAVHKNWTKCQKWHLSCIFLLLHVVTVLCQYIFLSELESN